MFKLLQLRRYLIQKPLYPVPYWYGVYIILMLFVLVSLHGVSFGESAKNDKAEESEGKVTSQSITAQSIPSEPTGSRFSPSSTFANSPGDSVDPASGALVIKQTDISLPGKGGLNLEVSRTYNSKGFKSNPRPSSFKNTNEIWDVWEQNDYESTFNFRIPLIADQWSGWIGQGWQSNIGGVLVAGYSDTNHPHSIVKYGFTGGKNWSEKLCPDSYDSIRITIGNKTYAFNNELKPKDKGCRSVLKKTLNGYILIDKNGIKYRFEEKYYYRLEKYTHHQAPLDHYEFRSEVYHLSAIEDPNNNRIQFIYDRYGESFYDDDKHIEKWTLTILGAKWGEIIYYTYAKELDYVEFIRPSKIIDSFGREINIHYQSSDPDDIEASMIDRISYKDSNGNLLTYRYVYDEDNNYLKEVVPPQGNSTKFDYTYKTEDLGDNFDDDGYILTKVTYPTGATISYNYEWYNPKDYSPSLIAEKEQALSNYVVSRRTVNNGQSWNYSYSGGELYSRYGEDIKPDEDYEEDKGEAWNFNKVTVADPVGDAEYQFEKGLIKSEENAEGHVTNYAWDFDKKNLLSVTLNKAGTTIKTEYKDYDDYGNHRIAKEYGDVSLSSDDREVHYEYVHDKNSVYKTNHIVNRISHAWMEAAGKTLNEVYSSYDAAGKGNLIQKQVILDSGSATTSYSYDSSGNLIRSVDPNGYAANYEYAAGSPNPTRISHLLTQSNQYYFPTGLLKSESDYNGNLTSYEYDKLGRITRKANPDGTAATYTYYDSSNEIEIKDENNNTTTYKYDNLGRLSEVDQPEGVTIRYQYNPFSKITSVTEASKTTTYSYDKIGRLTGVSYADGSSINCDHIDSQNAIDVSDAEGNTTRYKYDGLGRLVEVTEADSSKTTYGYTASGDISKITDAKELVTEYTYDRQSGLSNIKYSDGTTNSFSYDKTGNLVRKTDAKGQIINYNYDQINRLRRINYQDSTYDVIYTYDEASDSNGKGQLTTMKDTSGRTIYKYDKRGRLTNKQQTIGSISSNTSYSYDNIGNIKSIQDPIGNLKTHYVYDDLNRITEVKRDTSNSGQNTIAVYNYNTSGTIKEINFLNGLEMAYTYDRRDRLDILRLLDKSGNELLKHDYDYDSAGNRTALNIANVESISYDYDKVYRLTQVEYEHSEGDSVFEYDSVGNRLSFKYPYGDLKYFYSPRSNQLDYLKLNQHGKVDYSFDDNGNLIKEEYTKGNQTTRIINYSYDPEDRLASISYPYISVADLDAPSVPDTIINMDYDGNGKRIKKTSNGGTTVYHYDLSNNVICETDLNGQAKAYYIYANGQRICKIDPSGKMFSYHNDALGSPALISDEDGNIVQKYLYEPFGTILASKGPNDNHYTFTGKEYDLESGLFYFGARYYDPKIGRFITKDIAGPDYENPQSLNRYIYVLNNPVKYIDPAGLKALKATLYALRKLGGRKYGEYKYNKHELVCNEYVYFAYKNAKGEGISDFPRGRWQGEKNQIDWFRKRYEFISAKGGAARKAEIGDLAYFGNRGHNAGHVEMIIALRERKGIKEVALAGARGSTKSGIYFRKGANDLLWINLGDAKAVAKYFKDNPFRGIGQYKGTDYSAAEEASLLGQIETEIGGYLGGYPGGAVEVGVGVGF